ncbi:MAG: hypothetical protein H7Y42_11295 [Chitinophagaceae bacterium]|nr:hypothetical protein [Chitinophagaceae bacterium]
MKIMKICGQTLHSPQIVMIDMINADTIVNHDHHENLRSTFRFIYKIWGK